MMHGFSLKQVSLLVNLALHTGVNQQEKKLPFTLEEIHQARTKNQNTGSLNIKHKPLVSVEHGSTMKTQAQRNVRVAFLFTPVCTETSGEKTELNSPPRLATAKPPVN